MFRQLLERKKKEREKEKLKEILNNEKNVSQRCHSKTLGLNALDDSYVRFAAAAAFVVVDDDIAVVSK